MTVVSLGCGRQIPVRVYLSALRTAMAHPDSTFKRSFCSDWISATGREIVEQWREVVLAKINRTLPPTGKGNATRRRIAELAECKWCGQRTGGRPYCDASCARAYNS